MKVGTDAVLLGSWVNPEKSGFILDIGTGTGIIALMMAQKSDAEIDAIDIDLPSVQEANTNFKNTPWNDNLYAIHSSLSDFVRQSKKKYDLIVSNPPYFNNSLKSPSGRKNLSKHISTLTHNDLLLGVKKLISPEGKFAIIIPYDLMNTFKNTALAVGLYCNKRLIIYPTPEKPANRILMEFSMNRQKLLMDDKLIIRNESGNFTEEYKIFTGDFYHGF